MNADQYYEEKARYGLYEKYQDMSKKLGVIFWVYVVSNVLGLVNLSIYLVGLVFSNSDLASNIQLFSQLLSCIAAIVTGIMILTMREYDSQLGIAGLAYIVGNVLNILESLFPNSCFGTIMSMISSVALVIYILYFTRALSALTFNVNSTLADSWDLLRKVYIISLVTGVVAGFCLIIPFINILAAVVLGLYMFAMLGMGIWEMVMIILTSIAMGKYKLEDALTNE